MSVLLDSFKVDTSRRSVLLLIALALLPLATRNDDLLYLVSLFGVQLSALVGTIKKLTDPQSKVNRTSMKYLAFALGCVLIGDLHSNWGVITGSVGPFLTALQELAYNGFILGLALISVKYFMRGSGKLTLFIAFIAGTFHAALSVKFILIPFFERAETPTLFFLLTSTSYAILASSTFGLLFASASRVIGFHHFVFLQSLLLLLSSEFYIRHQWAAITQTDFSWTEPFWGMTFGAICWLTTRKKSLFPEETASILISETSIRSRMAQIFLGAVLITTASFLTLGVYATDSVLDLTVILLWIFVVWFLANVMSLYFAKNINSVRERISKIPINEDRKNTGVLEIDEIIAAHEASVLKAVRLQEDLAKAKEGERVAKISQQIAHDIRSPLAALSVLENELNQVPEDTRLLLRSAVQRIRDISNGLLTNKSSTSGSQTDDRHYSDSFQLLAALDPILSEKRIQYRQHTNLSIELRAGEEAYGLFTKLNATEFKRIISNLVDNAVEALVNNRGEVTIALSRNDKDAILEIIDNGHGIDPKIKSSLGKVRGLTHGKENGSGLGLFHAKTQIESAGGCLTIQSDLGVGTRICLNLPLASAPAWFLPELALMRSSQLVILDDDESIHQVWKSRFERLKIQMTTIQVHHFRAPLEFAEFLLNENEQHQTQYFLMDYELLGHRENGLDLIERFGLASRSTLVTGRFDDSFLLKRAERVAVPIIPKSMAGLVPLRIK